jgi:hypothetical protein
MRGCLAAEKLRSAERHVRRIPDYDADAKAALDPNSLQHIQEHANRTRQKINLGAAMLAKLTPVAEMFTVVSYHIIAPLSQPRAGAKNHIVAA